MKLKTKEIKGYREQQLALQNHCCALCGESIAADAVLDHDHKTGFLRQVLHRGCNVMLGKIENNMARNKMDIQRLTNFAANLSDYMQTQYTSIRHPTHLTKEERNEKLAIKRIKNREKQKRQNQAAKKVLTKNKALKITA